VRIIPQFLNDRACRSHGDWAASGGHWQAICSALHLDYNEHRPPANRALPLNPQFS
jgi:hypothetical protein